MNNNKVVLIMPHTGRISRYSGLGYLGATLRNQGFMQQCQPHFTHDLRAEVRTDPFDVTILDLSLAPKKFKLQNYLGQTRPAIVGVSAFFHNYRDAVQVAHIARKASPDSLRIIGGWEASPQAKKVLGESDFQMVVRNEGEESLVEVATLVRHAGMAEARRLFPQIKGLTFRNADKEIIETPLHLPNLDLDQYPFLYESFPLFMFDKYPEENSQIGKMSYVHGSRGCIFSCIYCANAAIYTKKIRYRSVENIMQELRALYALGARIISFRDEIFTADQDRARKIARAIKALQAEGIYIKWFCETRGDLLDEQLILDMKDAGLGKIIFGIESGDPEVVNLMKASRVDLDKCGLHTDIANQNDIATAHYYIFGAPGQTWQSMFRSWQFIKRHMPTGITSQVIKDLAGNKTAGLTRPVLEPEAKLAMHLFDHLFHMKKLMETKEEMPGIEEAKMKLEAMTYVVSNAMRFSVLFDLVLRSHPEYSDEKREELQKQLVLRAGSLNDDSFMHDYVLLAALAEKDKFPDMCLDPDMKDPFKQFRRPIAMPEMFFKYGIHPKVAEAYYDDFLLSVKFSNGFKTMKNMHYGRVVRFSMFLSILWELARQSKVALPNTVEFTLDDEKYQEIIGGIVDKVKINEIANPINTQYPNGTTGNICLNLKGLPIILNTKDGKIIVDTANYHPSDAVTAENISI